jgi:hypothetical protein
MASIFEKMATKKAEELKIKRRKALAMHYAKSDERLEFEATHDCYVMIVEDGGLEEVFIDGERYYKANQRIDAITKVDSLNLDGKTSGIIGMMKLRARMNGQRNQEVCGVWLPTEWADAIEQHKIHSDMEKTIIKYRFEI